MTARTHRATHRAAHQSKVSVVTSCTLIVSAFGYGLAQSVLLGVVLGRYCAATVCLCSTILVVPFLTTSVQPASCMQVSSVMSLMSLAEGAGV